MGFQEAFGRGLEDGENLLFDDQAFLYFAISILSILIIPLFYSIMRPLVKHFLFRDTKMLKRQPKSKLDQKVKQELNQEQKNKWLTQGFYLKVVILITMVFFVQQSYTLLPNENTIKGFDPYEILEIDVSATDAQVRKAFKKMSVKYHPDKNLDDAQASSKFILLTKAYECLTDETMKENCRKYGNPDGAKQFHVGIALPSFLLQKENRAAFLAVIFLLLLVFVPAIVLNALSSMDKYDDNGILTTNYDVFLRTLNENLILKNCPKLLSISQELATLQVTDRQGVEYLHRLTKDLIEEADNRKITNFELTELLEQRKKKKDKRQFTLSVAFLIIYTHLFGMEIDPSISKQFTYVIKTIPNLIHSMVMYALRFSNKYSVENLRSRGFPAKFMGLRCISTLLEFSQLIVQGIWEKDPDIFQVYFFRTEASQHMKREKFPELSELIKNDRTKRNLPNWVPQDKREEIHDELDQFPLITISTELTIEDDTITDMTNEDLLTLKITLTRENTPERQDIPFAHSNRYPFVKQEIWHLMISSNEDIFWYMKVNATSRTDIQTYKFFPKQLIGDRIDLNLTLSVKSDCYRGLDQEIPLSFKLKNIKDVKREVKYHEDDQKLDKELPFMNMMMNQMQQEEQQDSDLDSEEEEQQHKKQKNE